ncbi:hydrolase metallo-beta-lactamase superfamily [Anaeramoeba ignava]|uniref:Hydrolase metallo-beta-lactamase superfamily n=1 Tax=Anaeramoeba ignava TaxID=1746090 RepID=A0A9Q0RFL2_ANAIG|nr:hydrolase metallo-beta-lactamase superfamily [Anaeramoeba ignava]|eukprot:Anaeramoba_ignava/a489115_263.p1 GENE.a489115_263~~a489115_263.p1  ORF type:complete len:210 (-),score=62.90 a489115_263:39-668(-)
MKLKWLGHASFKIKTDENVIYIDPFAGDDYNEKANLILVSHDHFDHSDAKKIEQIRTDSTTILTTSKQAEVLKGEEMKIGATVKVGNDVISAIPAYNIEKQFHPKESGFLGFIVTSNGKSIYHAADTDHIPEMKGLKPTVALLPIGGKYTMDPKEAFAAVKDIQPEIVIPMHYGNIIGNSDDANNFKELVENSTEIKVIILKEGDEIDI